jgi:sugar phosphate isomerase/epimerase
MGRRPGAVENVVATMMTPNSERALQIGTRRIGPGEPCYVIAEVGINHNGDLAIARQLVDAAVAAGADAVKFQKRKLRETYREEIIDQPRHGEQGLQYIVPLLIEFELSDEQFRELFAYCRSSGITAMCTPWDRASVDFLETRDLAPLFTWNDTLFPSGPKIVMHVGGMAPKSGGYDLEAATDRLLGALRQLETTGVDLLLENLPPYPWYFGGRWFGHAICDPENTVLLCKESGLGLCFDTSHAALECARSGASLIDFARVVSPYVRHLHVSDGAGTSGEGLQIGDGTVNFVALLPVLLERQPTLIPEIWMGHHENGLAFRTALERLTEIRWASLVLGRPSDRRTRPDLRALTVTEDATVFTTLRVIDTNRMGIVFVLDGARHVVGVVTDGDIRHAFIRGMNLHDQIGQVMTRDFVHGLVGMSPAELRARLPGRTRVMPILDADRCLVDFVSVDTLGGATP